MKPSLLTQLGCLGSIAFALSVGTAAHAGTVSERTIIITASQSSNPTSIVSSGSNDNNSITVSQDQTLEQKAIAKYGCDCSSCQNRLLQDSLK